MEQSSFGSWHKSPSCSCRALPACRDGIRHAPAVQTQKEQHKLILYLEDRIQPTKGESIQPRVEFGNYMGCERQGSRCATTHHTARVIFVKLAVTSRRQSVVNYPPKQQRKDKLVQEHEGTVHSKQSHTCEGAPNCLNN